MGLTLLQRCLIHLSQHDRIGRRDGFASRLPGPYLIQELRETLTPEELAECDEYDPTKKEN